MSAFSAWCAAARRKRKFTVGVLVLALLSTVAMQSVTSHTSRADAAVASRTASMENGTFSEFSSTGIAGGTLTNVSDRAYDGSHSAKATYTGGSGNGYARGLFQNLQWGTGTDVWYGAAFYLPAGFKAANKGIVDLIRWDNWTNDPNHTDQAGLSLWNDGKLRFVKEQLGVRPYTTVLGPYDVPEGRWMWLEVHQRLSPVKSGSLTEVYLDGNRLGASTARTSYGRTITTLGVGIVAVDAANQANDLTLWFDRAGISPTRRGPIGSSPTPAPAPAPAHEPAPSMIRRASMENGNLSEFNGTNAVGGSLNVVSDRAYDGSRSAKATYNGNSGNGFSRGYYEDVNWQNGTDVWYGGAFYLPPGFKSASHYTDLMRWDNWLVDHDHADHGGLSIGPDGKLRFSKEELGSQPYTPLLGPYEMPEGQWVWLEVHQKFSATNGQALTEVYMNNTKLGSTTAANFYGRRISTVRYGIVAINANDQPNTLTLWFDRATMSNGRVGPIG